MDIISFLAEGFDIFHDGVKAIGVAVTGVLLFVSLMGIIINRIEFPEDSIKNTSRIFLISLVTFPIAIFFPIVTYAILVVVVAALAIVVPIGIVLFLLSTIKSAFPDTRFPSATSIVTKLHLLGHNLSLAFSSLKDRFFQAKYEDDIAINPEDPNYELKQEERL